MPPSDRDFARGMDSNHDGKITTEDWDILQGRIAKGQNVLVAIKPDGKGNVTDSHVAWKFTRGLPYVPSPLFYDGRLYLVKDGGMVSAFEAKTGKTFYLQERIGTVGSYYASPVAADGRIYTISVPGKLTVLKAGGDKPEVLHQADFNERAFATPALVGNNLYLRTAKTLFAF
jgi:outer membrane protein assembly factor BamB